MKIEIGIAAAAALLLTACQRSPQDRQADALQASARERAKQVEARADTDAKGLKAQAAQLNAQAKATGGYTGERLAVQADAAKRQADIVERQGHDQAQAATLSAQGQAEALRSR